jgi:hypothetical protein
VLCAALLLRLPFLNQAIQGDDFYYLKGAEHAQIDPLHPTHARYVFLGRQVDMRGHPHPPLDTWVLGGLLAAFGDIYEVPFHAAYIVFSVVAAFSMLALARRFCDEPLLPTALFLVTPSFVINGNSLESDVPFVAFWLAAIALFVYERYAWSAVAAAIAALAAYQAVLLAPILWVWMLIQRDRRKAVWLTTLTAATVIAVWQLYERASSGALPAGVLAGYMQSYNLQAFAQKVKSAAALTAHLGWIVFPALVLFAFRRAPKWVYACAAAATIAAGVYDSNPLFWVSCGVGVCVLAWCVSRIGAPDRETRFLAVWIVLFFAAALIIFFAGSARYLLPVAAPLAIFVARNASAPWICAGVIAEAVLSILLAIVNYQHWDGYRQFARQIQSEVAQHRTWTNAEWGLRYYLESEGALPVVRGQGFRAGDIIITTAYSGPIDAGPQSVIAQRTIEAAIPLRLVAPGARSGYSSVMFGLRPFDISRQPVDIVRASIIEERKPELSWLHIGSPEAASQILFGIYNNDRWTAEKAGVVVKRPDGATRVEAVVFVPPQAPAKQLRLYVDGALIATQNIGAPGRYAIGAPAPPGADTAMVTLQVDRTFSVPGDQRQLGVVLLEIGFR